MAYEPKNVMDAAVRGLLVGAGLGALAGYVNIVSINSGLILGGLTGCLAGITIYERQKSRKNGK
jgi:F0F1-type ATP synthase assembly protein I